MKKLKMLKYWKNCFWMSLFSLVLFSSLTVICKTCFSNNTILLHFQNTEHQDSLEHVLQGDRQSMLAEIRELRSELGKAKREQEDENGHTARQIAKQDEQYSKQERQLKRQGKKNNLTISQTNVHFCELDAVSWWLNSQHWILLKLALT